ncbi:MAG: NAD(P)-dependent oxidoreductase [Betaproteobacteria bacterium]|nr:NAD(P)-dependent oxidoreductase [Betaproteobacteria bacterium]
MKIGIAGTGRMGAAMALRLMSLGHQLTVWNRTAGKARALAEAGASVAATPAALAIDSEIVITILSNAAAVDALYLGPEGLLSAEVGGRLFIEMSTLRPSVEQALAAKIRAKGAALVDCPVGGTVGPAREGKLLGFAGGEAADVARAKPILEQLCRRVEHVGAVGSGASMKLAINLPLLVYWQVLGEALSLCQPLGLDPARVIDIFTETSGAPLALRARGPLIAAALQGKDTGPANSDLDLARKDLRLMIEEAGALGLRLPVTSRALECFDEASREIPDSTDAMTLPAHWLRSRRSRGEA